MKDQFEREIDYVRISLTDRCQLRCTYCMPANGIQWLAPSQQLSKDEIKKIVHILAELGIKKIKLTGGEPLLYPGLAALVFDLKTISGIEEVTLTTNGIKLPEMIDDLVKAGLDGVNISLDTLSKERYAEITRCDMLKLARAGLVAAIGSPLKKVKVNSVLIQSFTKQDALELVNLARHHPIHVRFIEWMPIGQTKPIKSMSEATIKTLIAEHYGEVKPFLGALGNGPARYYEVANFKGKIGFISAMTHDFCATCNRVRITSDGFLKTCLAFNQGVDLKQALKNDCLAAEILSVLKKKPKKHLLGQDFAQKELKNMIQIGG